MKDKIEFGEFLEIEKRLEIKLGTITDVERMEGSNKMLKLTVDFGDVTKIVMTNIGNREGLRGDGAEKTLTDLQLPFITNLEPAKIMGVLSEAMIMVPEKNGEIEIIDPSNGCNLLQ